MPAPIRDMRSPWYSYSILKLANDRNWDDNAFMEALISILYNAFKLVGKMEFTMRTSNSKKLKVSFQEILEVEHDD